MNVQTATSASQTIWLFGVSGRPASSCARPGKVVTTFVVAPALRSDRATESFDEHLRSLPSLADLVSEFRSGDPGFDARVERARRRRYRELLKEVKAGRLSRIAAERLKRGWTQEELAARAGMRQPNIARLERLRATISVRSAQKLAEALGLGDYRELLP